MSSGKSLVVGAGGQVGSQLVRALGLENVVRAARTAQPGWIQVDLANLHRDPGSVRRILDTYEIDAVYCVGAATDVERCETDHAWAMNTNYLGAAALAKLCRDKRFVYFSSEYVFDGVDGPYVESSPAHAISVYGQSKLLGEQACLEHHPSPLVLRTTVVYGLDAAEKNFLYALRRLLSAGKTMRVPSDQISTPTYNRDLAEASVRLTQAGETGVFHVCGPDVLSRYEFATRCAKLLGLDASLIEGLPTAELGQKAPRPLRAGLLSERLEQALPGFRMRGLRDGVASWLQEEVAAEAAPVEAYG